MASIRVCTIRKLTALLAALMMLCGAAEASNVQDSLVVGICSTKTTVIRPLDPQERDIVSVYDLVYESLVEINDSYEPAPGLAESWDVSSDGRTWTFHLRQSVTFSDGTPLTARDVVATAEYILQRAAEENSSDRGYYRNLAYFISSITATGDSTVVVKAKAERKYFGLLYAMTFPVLREGQAGSDAPAGTGPYQIVSFQGGGQIVLETNPYWWHSQPQVKRITFIAADTEKKVIENYQYARVDTIFTRSISASSYSTGTNTLVMSTRTNQLETLLINNHSWPLDDVRIRRAIRYAIDPDALASKVYMNMVMRTDTPFIPGTWLYHDDLSAYFGRNVPEAVRLLEEAGWKDSDDDNVRDQPKQEGDGLNRLHLRLLVYEEPDNNVRRSAASQIAESLAAVGIEVEIITGTMLVIQERLRAGNFDLCLAGFAMDVVPDPGFLLMNGNTGDYSRYRNSDMTALFNDLRTKRTKEEYQAQARRIQEKYAQDCPFICLYWRRGVVLTRRMYTTHRDVRELELLRGIETFASAR